MVVLAQVEPEVAHRVLALGQELAVVVALVELEDFVLLGSCLFSLLTELTLYFYLALKKANRQCRLWLVFTGFAAFGCNQLGNGT